VCVLTLILSVFHTYVHPLLMLFSFAAHTVSFDTRYVISAAAVAIAYPAVSYSPSLPCCCMGRTYVHVLMYVYYVCRYLGYVRTCTCICVCLPTLILLCLLAGIDLFHAE
jgi:hypothetical protein